MNSPLRMFSSGVMIFLLALVSAISVIPARADGGAPPPPASPASPSSAAVHAPADLSKVPAGTDVVVVNRSGHKVALATQEAAHIVAAGDPMWCPVGIVPGNPACSPADDSFNNSDPAHGLIAWLAAHTSQLNVNGVIWIEGNYDSSVAEMGTSDLFNVVLNGTGGSLGNMKDFTLAVKGGWSGIGTTIDPTNPSHFNNTTFSVINWNNDVTISDIVIQNVTNPGVSALHVTTSKKITLTNMAVDSNAGAGAILYNAGGSSNVIVTSGEFNENAGGTGLEIDSKGAIALQDIDANLNTAGAGVRLNNSLGTLGVTLTGTNIFTGNGSQGLSISTNGAIALSNVSAVNNNGSGASLNNAGTGGAQPVTLTGSNEFKFNGYGLSIISNGAVTLHNITASGNNVGDGLYVNTTTNHLAPQNVTVTGYGNFNANKNRSGLEIYTYGAITLPAVTANNNGNYGAILNNYGDTSGNFTDPAHFATLPKGVTITGAPDSDFNGNGLDGLDILSFGTITLNGVNANGNQTNGARLNNDFTGSTGGITFGGWGAGFGNNNGGYGLNATTRGVITGTGLWAWGNSSYGAMLDNTDAITPKSVTISGPFGTSFGNNNGGTGLTVYSHGAITLKDLGADNNGSAGADGVYLKNDYTGAVGGISLTGNTEFRNNNTYGLEAYSNGAITLNNVEAGSNNGTGIYLDTTAHGSTSAITFTGSNNFHDNPGDGVYILSNGAVTFNNVDAGGNGTGIYLDTTAHGSTSAITFTGSNNIHDNAFIGLSILGLGAVTLNNMDAGGNGVGIDINAGNTSLNGNTNIHDNHDTGLNVYSNGNILLHNMDVHGNGTDNVAGHGEGADLIATGNVTISGYGNFHENYYNGLHILAAGTVTLSNINASNNGFDKFGATVTGYGVYIENYNVVPKAVTLTGNNGFYHNVAGGLYVSSRGAITVNNLEANDSPNGTGAALYNASGPSTSPQNVTITGYGHFYNNLSFGLDVNSYGAITLANIDENGNNTSGADGIRLINSTGTIAKPVTISGFINSNNNYGTGLFVLSLGAITIANLNVDHNRFGAYLENCKLVLGVCTAPAPAAVTLTGNVYTTNSISGDGMYVVSKGAITFTLGNAYIGWNNGSGWTLNNSNTGAVGGITLSAAKLNDINFDSNGNGLYGGYGLQALSLGNIKITNLDAYNNGRLGLGYGVSLSNAFGGSVGTVTLLTTGGNDNFNSNKGDGLDVSSNRAISITSLHTDSNTGVGASLDNSYSGKLSPQNVTLVGASSNNNNGGDGLDILSYGIITLNAVDAYSNGQNNFYNQAHALLIDGSSGWGVHLSNCGNPITCAGAVTPKAVTLNGNNNMSSNFLGGLWVISLGAIKVNQVNANTNGLNSAYLKDGVYLNNQWTGAVGGITLTTTFPTWTNSFNNNGSYGLEAFSNGALTLSSIFADGNLKGGAWLDNCHNAGFGCTVGSSPVTLSGRNRFTNNGNKITPTHISQGLVVNTFGAITINNLIATGNDGTGATLDNCAFAGASCTATGSLTLTGTNDFSGNFSTGLFFQSGGNVSLTRVTADSNNVDGIAGSAQGSITLTCGSFNNNFGYGLYLSSPATITLIHVIATGNSGGDISTTGGGSTVFVRTCPLP